MLVETFQRLFKQRKERRVIKALLKRNLELGAEKLSKLVDLVSSENFSIFLDFLELTISENLVMLSGIELLDDDGRKQAIKLQHQTRGLLQVRHLVEDLINRSKELAREVREKEDERNN